MSYDLAFWRQQPGVRLDPVVVHAALLDGHPVAGLVDLPLAEWLAALLAAFPGAVREPNGAREWIDWVSTDQSRSFQVEWSDQHVLVSCRGLSGEEMNRHIDLALSYGCRLYDPQTGERFAS